MSIPQISLPLDLSYLYEISDDDREFVKDMIDTIVKNTPDSIKEIKVAADKNNWIEVGRLVHKLKPSLLLLNIDSVSKHIKVLENNAKEEINLEDAIVQLGELMEYSAIIIHELSTAVEQDNY
ncbi:MAG: hypothetical protein JXR07_11250 [Reichenbachiella sp.]